MAVYYISPTGNNNNNGTSTGTPWATFSYAINNMNSGDELRVMDGVYNQRVVPISDITITGHSTPSNALIRGISATNHIIDITGVSNVVVKNLQVSYNPNHADPPLSGNTIRNYWINIGLSANNIIIDNIQINKASVNSIATAINDYKSKYRERGIHTQGSNIEIKNCNIRGVNAGIVVKGSGNNIYIHDNDIYEVVQSCIVSQDSGGVLRNLIIENNSLHGAYTEDGVQFQDSAIKGQIATRMASVRNNLIYGNRENAIDLKGAGDILIEGNVLFGNVGSSDETQSAPNRNAAGAISRGSGSESENIIVRNNVIYDSHKGVKLAGNNMKVYNNDIIYNNRDYTGTDSVYDDGNNSEFLNIDNQFAGYNNQGWVNNVIGGAKNSAAVKLRANGITIDNNIYFPYTSGADVLYNYLDSSNTTYTGLAAWQAFLLNRSQVSGKEINSIELSNFAAVDYATLIAKPSTLLALEDFIKNVTSPAYQAAIPLTEVVAQIDTKSFTVLDATWFTRYFNDTIVINGTTRVITDINYTTNTITVSSDITVSNGDPIYWQQENSNIGILQAGNTITSSFTINIDGNCVPTLATFTDTSIANNTITDWLWNFGDGTTSTNQNPTHSYATPGVYTITLSVTSVDGTSVSSKSIDVVDCVLFDCSNNILVNGSFDTDLSSWVFAAPDSAISSAIWNNSAVEILTTQYSSGTLNFSQNDIPIIGGQTYKLQFDAVTVTGVQTLRVRFRTLGSPYTTNGLDENYLITTNPQTISTVFVADFDDVAIKLMFIANYVDTTIIDNVCLVPLNDEVEPTTKLPPIVNKYSINTIGTIFLKNTHPAWIDLFPSTGLNLMGMLSVSYNIFSGLGQAIEPITKTILSWNIDTGSYSISTFEGVSIASGADTRLSEYGLAHPVKFGLIRGPSYWNEYYIDQNTLYGVTIENWPALLDAQYNYAQEL